MILLVALPAYEGFVQNLLLADHIHTSVSALLQLASAAVLRTLGALQKFGEYLNQARLTLVDKDG